MVAAVVAAVVVDGIGAAADAVADETAELAWNWCVVAAVVLSVAAVLVCTTAAAASVYTLMQQGQ